MHRNMCSKTDKLEIPFLFWNALTVGKRVLDRSFLTGTSDFGMVERTSATISGVGYPLIPAADLSKFKSQLRVQGSRKEKS